MRWMPLKYNDLDLSEKFLVSENGDIYSVKSRKVIRQTLNKSNGYLGAVVSLGSRGNKKYIKTHIAVACSFLHGREDGLVVNHKDGNKQNNNCENLEWVTQSENIKHAIRTGLYKANKKVRCINNGLVFDSIKEASLWCGFKENSDNIGQCLRDPKRIYAGRDPVTKEKLKWEFVL